MFPLLYFFGGKMYFSNEIECSLCGSPGLARYRASSSKPENCMVATGPLLSFFFLFFSKPLITTSTVILQWSLASSPLHPMLQQSKTADTAFILLGNLSMQTSFCSSFTLYFEERHCESRKWRKSMQMKTCG